MENDGDKRVSDFVRQNATYKLLYISESGLYELVSPTFSVTISRPDLLSLADLLLDGEIEYRNRRYGALSSATLEGKVGPRRRRSGVVVDPEVVRRR